MLKFLHTDNHKIYEVSGIFDGVWIKLQRPTSEEVRLVASRLDIDIQDILAALDPDEKTRIEIHEDYTLIIVDIPIYVAHGGEYIYKTIPLGIIFNRENIVTVCSEETPLINYFQQNRIKDFSTKKKLKFIYQMMFYTSGLYQQALTNIDKQRMEIEKRMEIVRNRDDLLKIHELESTLVYFVTSLSGNNNVLNKLASSNLLSHYPEDRDLLNDVIVENHQAIEMAQIYREIIDSTRELILSLMNLKTNEIMKRLTSITLIFSIPMIISGMYGMNVDARWVPLAQIAHGFGFVGLITAVICLIVCLFLKKKDML